MRRPTNTKDAGFELIENDSVHVIDGDAGSYVHPIKIVFWKVFGLCSKGNFKFRFELVGQVNEQPRFSIDFDWVPNW